MGRSKSDRWEEGESEGRPVPEQVDRTLTWANTAATACRTRPSRQRSPTLRKDHRCVLGLGRSAGDIGTVLSALKADALNGLVGACPSLLHGGSQSDDGQDAPTGGHQLAVLGGAGAGVQDVDVVELLGSLDPGDGAAGRHGIGVTGGGDNDVDGALLGPCGFGGLGEAAGGGGVEQLGQGGGQAGQDGLGLRVAEADVELDDAQSAAGQGQTAVEQADEAGTAAGHLVHDGLGDLAHHLLGQVRRSPWQGRVGAHTAGVGAGIVVEEPLEVLGGGQRADGGTVAHAEQGGFRAVEIVLDDDAAAAAGQAGTAMSQGHRALIGDDDALAGGQAVLLDDVWGPEAVQGGGQLGLGGAYGGLGGGHTGSGHDLLGEGLRALQTSRLGAGTEAGDPGVAHGVGDARHQWRLGTHDDEVGLHLGGQGNDLLGSTGVDVEVRGDGCGPRITGGDDELGGLRVTGEGTGQGVLARAGAEKQDLHGLSLDDGNGITPGIAGAARPRAEPAQAVSRENQITAGYAQAGFGVRSPWTARCQEAQVEVDQSPATTAVGTQAGAVAKAAPATEAAAAINAVTIRRLGAVHLPPATGRPTLPHSVPPRAKTPTPERGTDAGIETALTTMRALGYVLSAPAREALASPEAAWTLVNAAARLTSGAPTAEYRPFYPDFPVQVRDTSETTLLVNAALHYLGDVVGARILPAYWPSPREPLPEDDSVLTELDLATEQDLERIAVDLFAQATPFSVQDRADLTALRDHGPSRAPHVAVKENLAVLTVAFPGLDFSASYRTVTDVLRLAVAMAGGDVSLAEPCRFPSFSRAQRRRLLGLLDAVGQVQDSRDSTEEMARRSERWKRLARHLRASDYARRFPRAAELLRQVASGSAEPGFGSRLEEALARRDVEGAIHLLVARPGVFARRLNHLLRLCGDNVTRERVVAEFARIAPKVSLPVLVRLWEYFSSPGPDALPWRVVTIKSGTGIKTTLIPSTRHPGHADAAVVRTVEKALRMRASLGRITVDQQLYEGYTVPLGQRSASPGLRTAGRGTRLPLPEGETIRFFLHWRDLPEAPRGSASASSRGTRVDLDLSAFFVSEDLTRTEQIAYYNLRSTAAVHSGDLTSAPDGAAEFIDVTLPEALRQGWRYVVMTVHSFSHHPLSEVPECWAGAMARGADPQRGEVFEASTVMQRLDLTSPGFNATPFVIDLAERRLIWWDLAVEVGEHQVANLDHSTNRVLAHLLDLLEGRRMPLAHLLTLLADAVVEDPDAARLVFGEGGIMPWQTERILALLAPAEATADKTTEKRIGDAATTTDTERSG